MEEQPNHYSVQFAPADKQKKKNPSFLQGKVFLTILLVFAVTLSYFAALKMPAAIQKKDHDRGIIDSKSAVEVEVVDTYGNHKQAEYIVNLLRENGFDVVEFHRVIGHPVDYSYVVDHTDTKDASRKIAECIGIQKTKIYTKPAADLMVDVSLVLGNDIDKLKPYQTH
ncbi:MAG: LytR C-terminal domain-containing protein [Bacteroidota bacterium]